MDHGTGKKPININRYEDPTGELTTGQLKFSEWYVRHRQLINQILTGTLIVFAVGFNVYGLIGWGNYLVFGLSEDIEMEKQVTATFQNYNRVKPLYQAESLQTDAVEVYSPSARRYDLRANITNPNRRYLAQIEYKFTYDNGETDVLRATILPGETQPVTAFGIELEEGILTNARFDLVDLMWRRINPHVIFDPVAYIEPRKQFVVKNFSFTPQSLADNIPSNVISFDIENRSVYSYWDVDLVIELLNGSQVVGLMKTRADEFSAGETRQIINRNTTEGLGVSDIRVYPIDNVFDRTEFLPARALETIPGFELAPEDAVDLEVPGETDADTPDQPSSAEEFDALLQAF